MVATTSAPSSVLSTEQLDHKLARARALDMKIAAVARRRKRKDAELAYLLWQFAREGLPPMLKYADVGVYAVDRGYVESERVAHDLVKLAERLQEFETLRTLFRQGDTDYSKMVRILPHLTRENEAKRADQVMTLGSRELENELREEKGLPRQVKRTYTFGEEEYASVEQRVQAEIKAARARGEELTPGQALARICDGSLLESAASNKAPPYRIVINACECGEKAWRQTRQGPVPVSPETVRAALVDGLVADAVAGPAEVTSEIPPMTRAYVIDRDQGRCRAPGCKNMGYLHVHHEPGRKMVGHDPDYMLLACTAHHPARHAGKIRIEGRHSTGFRWFLHDGTELVAPPPAAEVVPPLPESVMELDVRLARAGLKRLGIKTMEAKALLERAREELSRRCEVCSAEALLQEALRLKPSS